MANFDVSIVYCCPYVIGLVKYEISRTEVLTQALVSDFIWARFQASILNELFSSMSTILIKCVKHLVECLYFDWKLCSHYNRRTFFTAVYESQTFRVSKCRYCYKMSLTYVLDNFLRVLSYLEIQFKKFSNKAVQPFLTTPGSDCFDICSADNYLIYPNSVQMIQTDVGLVISHGFFGKIVH